MSGRKFQKRLTIKVKKNVKIDFTRLIKCLEGSFEKD